MLLQKIVDYCRGSVLLRVEKRYENGFFRMLMTEKVPAQVCEVYENGEKYGIEAVISPKFIKKLASVLDKYSIKVYIINIKGFCTLLPHLKRRIGVAVGSALFFMLLWISTLFLWRIDIVGAETVSNGLLREALAQSGVSPGVAVSDIDAFAVSNSLLLSCPQLSWASLEIKGTTATLTVRETVDHLSEKENETALLVASESGIVQSVLVYKGAAAVKPGSVVKAGDALINGLISGSGLQYSDQPVLRIGKADGSVKALVERELSVTVPYLETELIPKENGRSFISRSIKLFGGSLQIGKRKPSAGEFTQTENVTELSVFGATLPVTVYETVWNELTEHEIKRTPEEAEELARGRATEALTAELGEDELTFTEYTVTADEENGAVTVKVKYRCITEIAVSGNIGNTE